MYFSKELFAAHLGAKLTWNLEAHINVFNHKLSFYVINYNISMMKCNHQNNKHLCIAICWWLLTV